MKYMSTRGRVSGIAFKDAVMMGLADDGGLLIPEQIPDVRAHLEAWRRLDYVSFAQQVLRLFIDDIAHEVLDGLVADAYASFSEPDVVRFAEVGDVTVLELFHGPTLAFKDVALQLLGGLFAHILAERGGHLNILGATSGDTGSAAIAGVRGRPGIDIVILFPQGRVSPLQELQMTTVPDANVHCVAVEGSFDDCQSIVKSIFSDLPFKQRYSLGAVNSVNWARVLAQVVYYGYTSLRFDKAPAFCVPTGNFGNIFAGYMAHRMGFPIERFILATNANDILARFFATGDYARGSVHHTHSPAMDIQVASNFERYLFYLLGEDAGRVRTFFENFTRTGSASTGAPPKDPLFLATAVDNVSTEATIRSVHQRHGYVADPHTAVGLQAASRFPDVRPLVCVGTAHPAKFPEVVDAVLGEGAARHPALDALRGKPTRRVVVPASEDAVKAILRQLGD
ncbi:MAG: threonine synthase [Pseudomonadales bacterium]|nr:threonine synthase [Pseudomonadales bacterium]MCP5184103.1 threonine synthase [Pseudomonadales bacterium]